MFKTLSPFYSITAVLLLDGTSLFLQTASDSAFLCFQMEKALVSLASKTEDKAPENKATASPPSSVTPATSSAAPLPAALKGVSQSLLDRVLQLILLPLFNVSLCCCRLCLQHCAYI